MKSRKELPSYAEVSERLAYNPKKGEFTYLKSAGNVKKGTVTKGTPEHGGYYSISFKGKSYKSHQIAWLLHYEEDPGCILDHINCDKGDNRIKNLRKSDHSKNQFNRRDVAGTHFNKLRKKWTAQIFIEGIKKHLGSFESEEEARAAYVAVKKFCGLG